MIIYTKLHLKEVCSYFTPKLQEIFDRKFSPANIRELVASLTPCNSYAHLCDTLKRHPVHIEHNEANKKPFDILLAKHKLRATEDQRDGLSSLCYKNPLALVYAPGCDFPVSSSGDSFGPQEKNPLPELKANAIEFFKLSKPTEKAKGEYPEMELDDDFDVDDAISMYIEEFVDIGFDWESDVIDKGLSEEEGDLLYEKTISKWRRENKDTLEDMRVYFLENTAGDRYLRLLAEGGVVENYEIGLKTLDENDLVKKRILSTFSEDASLVYWRTVQPDTEFLSGGQRLQEAFIGTQVVYLGVLDRGEFTPIATASGLTLNFAFSNERELFHICDAHSACMNDVYKEIRKHISMEGVSWREFIEENSMNYTSCITRIWSRKNIYGDDAIDAFAAKIMARSFVPVSDEFIDDLEFTDASGAPVIHDSCIVFTEVCGARPKDGVVNILNAYRFDEIGEDERPAMSNEEVKAQEQQKRFARCLEKSFEGSETCVVTYDPWSHPLS